MKKLYAYMFIFSMLTFSVIAANSYEAGDFNKNPEQIAVLEERDKIRINWEDKEHQIHVRAIYLDKKKVDLTAFIEGSEVPYYTTITSKTSLQLDFNRDDVYDLKVSISNIIEEEGKKFVALKLEKLETPPVISGEAVINQDSSALKNNIIYILLGVGVVLLILISLFFKRKSNLTSKGSNL